MEVSNWPEPGIYEGKCWLLTVPKEETRTFATFIKHAQILYTARTKAGPDHLFLFWKPIIIKSHRPIDDDYDGMASTIKMDFWDGT
jgi:hypothetical protein